MPGNAACSCLETPRSLPTFEGTPPGGMKNEERKKRKDLKKQVLPSALPSVWEARKFLCFSL